MNNLDVLYSFLIGDGTLSKSDVLEVGHGNKQLDYLEWKKDIISKEFSLNPTICKHKRILNGKEFGYNNFYVALRKRFGLKGLRKEIYGNKRKNYIKILNKIKNIDFLLAVWFGDDGMIRRRVTNGVTNSAGLDIASFDQGLDNNLQLVEWFKATLNITPKIKIMRSSRQKSSWYYLSFSQPDSMIIWNKIRKTLLPINSMSHKFRHIEEKFNRSFSYLEYNPSERPHRPINQKYSINDLPCSLNELIESYKSLNSAYKVAEKYKISASATKRMLKEAGVLRTQSCAAAERTKI